MSGRARIALVGGAALIGLLLGSAAVWYAVQPAPQDGMSDEQTRQLLQEIGYLK